jgi:transglutaminase-like putative cysteine protease
MNRFHLVHTTEFLYDGPVSESYNEVRLRPIHDDRQSCLSFRLTTTPVSRGTSYRDAYGNWVHQFNVMPEHNNLRVLAESVVLSHEVPESGGVGMSLTDLDSHRVTWEEQHFDFLAPTGYVPHLMALREISKAAEKRCDGSARGFVGEASGVIHEGFKYVKGATHVHSSIEDALSIGAGVCQDFAHLLLGVARMRGLPARYVSGYLVPNGGATGLAARQEEVIGGQASHAWTEVLLPEEGWMAFDPTLGKPVGLRHVRVAYGRDYGDVAPVRGVYKGSAGQRLAVDVRVRPILDEDGHEQISEASAPPSPEPPALERPQQPPQQQQQQ